MTWQTDALLTRGYQFSYDGLSRLKDAIYGEGSGLSLNVNRFNEQVTGYDKMGNILALKRYGQTTQNDYGLIDNLSLSYEGNQLKAVNDNAISSAYGNGFEFKDRTKQSVEYRYDANGNLTQDLNKKITDIQYNCLNLPRQIQFEGGNSVSFLYDANGTKLRTTHIIDGTATTTDYCGNVIFENGTPKTVLTEAGFVSLDDNKYHYYLQDHQGNNRVVTDQNGNVEEVNHYYPFGGIFASSSSIQPYKYNGKELDRKNGLDWYDYGARHYDAALGRWNAVDPMAEKFYGITPYNYCLNNPIKHIDLDGKQGIPIPLPVPLPIYYPMPYKQDYRYPTSSEIRRYINNGINSVKAPIENTYTFFKGYALITAYQTKQAISPEYEHQRNRERKSKEELDRNQANVARSIDTNISGMMPNGDPAPKKNFKSWKAKVVFGATEVAVLIKDYYDNFIVNSAKSPKAKDTGGRSTMSDESNNKKKENINYISTPIINRLDDTFKKSW